MKVYEALAKAFAAEGTSAVFGMMGNTTFHWIDALNKLNVPIYEVRHEGPGLAMAESWAVVNGSPGVCTTTSGPGVTQLATTMVVASRSRTPLVAFCGDTPWGKEEDTQKFDLARFAAAVECEFVRVAKPELVFEATQRAFYIARTESRPVMLSAPIDVQLAEFDDTEEYTPSTALLSRHRSYPNPEAMKIAVDIVAKSKRPVILVGRGAITSGAADIVVKLADRIGAIIATSVMALNWPRDAEFHVGISGLFATRTAIELFQDADCVIAAGASLNHYTTEHGYLYPEAKFVHFDTKAQVIMGDGRLADCYVQSDARIGLEVLEEELSRRSTKQAGYRTAEIKERLSSALEDPVEYQLEPGTLDPRRVCHLLDEAISDDIGLIISGSHGAQMALMIFRNSRPFTFTNKNFGSMSKGIAAVIGAATASGQPTALIEGDVGFMMHIGEFETAVRYQLPILVAIMNDQAMGAEFHHALAAKGIDADLTRIPTPDLGQVGIALGGRGHLVRTEEELKSAVDEFVKNPGPMIIDIRTSSNVEAIPVRRLHGDDSA